MQKQVPKKIRPSKRPKKRYILFTLASKEAIQFGGLKRFFDDFFARELKDSPGAFCQLVLFDSATGKGIARCRRDVLAKVKQALESISRLGSLPVQAKVLRVSGTIKKLKTVGWPKPKFLRKSKT